MLPSSLLRFPLAILLLLPSLLGVYYAFSVFKIYSYLQRRKRLVLKYANNDYEPVKGLAVTNEEFEKSLQELQKSAAHPEIGFFSTQDSIAKIMRESIPFVGGGAAALLQVAHPYVAQGVHDHSNVKEDPFQRFQGTFKYMFRIYFGDIPTVLKSARTVRAIHNRVHGTFTNDSGVFKGGERYQANDQEAMKWVFATLIETSLFLCDMLVFPLSKEEKSLFLSHSRKFVAAFGVSPLLLPSDYDEFEKYYFSVCNSRLLRVTKEGQEICDSLMKPLLWEKCLPFNTLRTVTGVLLPHPVASQFGFDASFGSYFYTALVLALFRLVYLILPRNMRYLTGYLELEAREEKRDLPKSSQIMARFTNTMISWLLQKE